MIRKIIKLNEEGKEMTNEDGTFIFEEIELSETTEEVSKDENNDSTTVEDKKTQLDPDVLKEMTKAIISEVKKTLNISEPIKKVEQVIPHETKVRLSSGFNPGMLKKGNK